MGAKVTLLDLNLNRLRELDDIFGGRVYTVASNSYNVERAVCEADLVIGGVLIPGAAAPKIVTKAMVSKMKKGAVIVDVAIDQGGCIETARPTTHSDPSYVVDGVVHYCVTNMPAAVPNTSTLALTNATFPYVMKIAKMGATAAIKEDKGIAEGVNTLNGVSDLWRSRRRLRAVIGQQFRSWCNDMTTRFASGFLAAFLASGGLMAQAHPVSIQILAINDLHGFLEPPVGGDGKINGTPAGGAEYLATHLHHAEKDNPNTIVVAAGDLFGASPLLSALSEEKPTIEALDAMHMAVNALGNHELDHGPAVLKARLKDSHIDYLAANTVTSDGKTLFPSTVVKTIGGVKVGFIGEILEDAPSVISHDSIRGIKFLAEGKAANEAAAKLEREGVHTIVLLVHEGGFQHASGAPLDPNGCANFSGEIKDVAETLSPSIQVVISGHTHSYYNCEIAGHSVTSASSYGRMFTRVNLTVDSKTGKVLSVKATNEIVTRDVEKDPAQTAIIAKYKPVVDKVSKQPVGSITDSISRRTRATDGEGDSGESAMGDVIADAQLAATSAPDKGGAVIAFMNPGGIRAELPGPARDRDLWRALLRAALRKSPDCPHHDRRRAEASSGAPVPRHGQRADHAGVGRLDLPVQSARGSGRAYRPGLGHAARQAHRGHRRAADRGQRLHVGRSGLSRGNGWDDRTGRRRCSGRVLQGTLPRSSGATEPDHAGRLVKHIRHGLPDLDLPLHVGVERVGEVGSRAGHVLSAIEETDIQAIPREEVHLRGNIGDVGLAG